MAIWLFGSPGASVAHRHPPHQRRRFSRNESIAGATRDAGKQFARASTRVNPYETIRFVHVAGTAIAGTQSGYKVVLENCYAHVAAIFAHLTGRKPPAKSSCELPQAEIQPES